MLTEQEELEYLRLKKRRAITGRTAAVKDVTEDGDGPAKSTLPIPVRAFIGLGAGLTQRAVGTIQAGADLLGAEGVSAAAGRAKAQIDRDVASLGTSGDVGRVAGDVVPFLAAPMGAASIAGRAGLGAAAGALEGFSRASDDSSLTKRAGDAATSAVIGAVAVPALEGIGRGAGKAVQWLRQPRHVSVAANVVGEAAKGVDDVGRIAEVQDILKASRKAAGIKEDAAWSLVRKEASGQSLSAKAIEPLRESILEAQARLTSNDSAGVVDRVLSRWNRFIEAGKAIPAEELIANRATLSKASVNDAGLRQVVKAVEDTLEGQLNVRALPKALSLSRQRFQVFDNAKAVAEAVADGATPERFGSVLMGANSPSTAKNAGQYVDEVLKAAGGKRAQAQQLIDQAVSHRILQVARSQDGEKIALGRAANEIANLRMRNQSLWNRISPDTRKGLVVLERGLRREGEAGALNKVGEFALSLVSRAVRPFGLQTNLRLPSPIAPKSVADFDEVVKLLRVRPEEGPSILDGLVSGARGQRGSASIGNVIKGTGGGLGAAYVASGIEGGRRARLADEADAYIANAPQEQSTASVRDEIGDLIRQQDGQGEKPAQGSGLVDKIIKTESGGKSDAKNPRSSALGPGQFVNSTWLELIEKHRPDLKDGRTKAELLRLRRDEELSREMVELLAAENANTLRSSGLPVTDGTVYLSHFAGVKGAQKVLNANPNEPIAKVLGRDAVQANPFLRGKTASELVRWAERKMASR